MRNRWKNWQAYGVTLRLLNPLAPSLTLCSFIHYALKIELYIRKQNEPIHCQGQITRSDFFMKVEWCRPHSRTPDQDRKKRQDEVCKKRTLFFNIFILLYKYQKASFITSNSSILWSPPPPYTPNYFPNSSKHKQVQQQSYSTTSVLFLLVKSLTLMIRQCADEEINSKVKWQC